MRFLSMDITVICEINTFLISKKEILPIRNAPDYLSFTFWLLQKCHKWQKYLQYLWIYFQWSLQEFFGGTPWLLKGYTRPQEAPGRQPPDGNEVLNLKRNQSFRKWIHISKISTFYSFQKNQFFYEKFRKIFC